MSHNDYDDAMCFQLLNTDFVQREDSSWFDALVNDYQFELKGSSYFFMISQILIVYIFLTVTTKKIIKSSKKEIENPFFMRYLWKLKNKQIKITYCQSDSFLYKINIMEGLKKKNRTTLHSITSLLGTKSNNNNTKIKLFSIVQIASKQSINHLPVSESFLASHRNNVFQFLKKTIELEMRFDSIFQEKQKKTSLLEIKGEQCRSVVWQDNIEEEKHEDADEQQYIDDIREIDEILQEMDVTENGGIPLRRSEPKKLSIVFGLESSCTVSENDFLFSDSSFKNLSSLQLPEVQLTPQFLDKIYNNTDLFCINMSICLLLKLLHISQMLLNKENVVWLLCTANMIGYKMHEDIQVNNFVQIYSKLLNISTKEVTDLEKWFLYLIQYRTLVSKSQYEKVIEMLRME